MTTLTQEARAAMDGITGEPCPNHDAMLKLSEFYKWCHGGGVRRLVERLEELEARDG